MDTFIVVMLVIIVVIFTFFIVFLFCAFAINRINEERDRKIFEEAEKLKETRGEK